MLEMNVMQEFGLWQVLWNDLSNSIHLGQDRDRWRLLVNMVMVHLVPHNAQNLLSISAAVSVSRRAQIKGCSQLIQSVMGQAVP
jgi:hypothetical protein